MRHAQQAVAISQVTPAKREASRCSLGVPEGVLVWCPNGSVVPVPCTDAGAGFAF